MMFDTAQNVDPRKHFLLSPLKKKTNKVKKNLLFDRGKMLFLMLHT